MNSWTAEPGALCYDDGGEGPRPNATCAQCQRRFRSESFALHQLCDRCLQETTPERIAVSREAQRRAS